MQTVFRETEEQRERRRWHQQCSPTTLWRSTGESLGHTPGAGGSWKRWQRCFSSQGCSSARRRLGWAFPSPTAELPGRGRLAERGGSSNVTASEHKLKPPSPVLSLFPSLSNFPPSLAAEMEQVLPESSFFSTTTHNAGRPASPWDRRTSLRRGQRCRSHGWPCHCSLQVTAATAASADRNGEKVREIQKKNPHSWCNAHEGTKPTSTPPNSPPLPTQPETAAPVRLTAQATANPQFRYIVQSLFILGYLHARCQRNQVISRKYLAWGPASPLQGWGGAGAPWHRPSPAAPRARGSAGPRDPSRRVRFIRMTTMTIINLLLLCSRHTYLRLLKVKTRRKRL